MTDSSKSLQMIAKTAHDLGAVVVSSAGNASSDTCTVAPARFEHTLAVKSDGTVWTWGYNGFGQLGDGTVVSRMEESAFDAVLDVNLKGVFLCTRAVVPGMIRRGGGVILNASSVVGLYGNFGQTNYAATKGGVITMTQTWARELGRHGIRVNAVAPGFIATEMVLSIPEKVRDRMAASAPLGRLGAPDDIANAYAWLASPEAAFVHGTVLSVDGGLVMGT